MSAITWTTEAAALPLAPSNRIINLAQRLGFGVALILAAGSAYAAILLAILMATSIFQF